MLKLPYTEDGLKEVQLFIGISANIKKNDTVGEVLEIDLYRVLNAGSGNSLFANEGETLTFVFNNRHLMVALPEDQRAAFYQEIIDKLYLSDVREVVFTLNTRYRNYYSGEDVSTTTERFSVERELIYVVAHDITKSRYYMPLDANDDFSDLVTVRDCVAKAPEIPVDKTHIVAGNILTYFDDVPKAFYNHGESIKDYYWMIYPKLHTDAAKGHIVYGGHMAHSPGLHESMEISEVLIRTKDKLREVRLKFMDPQNMISQFFTSPGLTICFRDAILYGVDLCVDNYDIENTQLRSERHKR